MKGLLQQVARCRLCESVLPHGCRPVVRASRNSRILIIGQAPGRRVHESGIPWNDPSGDQLREWLQVDNDLFYDPDNFALMPMGFCYPGTGKSGDLPPRPECAPQWHPVLRSRIPQVQLTLLIGQYAQKAYLKEPKKNLTENVRAFATHGGDVMPLPHPSPRNRLWQKKNPWFLDRVVPELRAQVAQILG